MALDELLASVRDYRIPAPLPDHDSLIEYDRRRMTKESLLERVISTSVETADAGRLLSAAVMVLRGKTREDAPGSDEEQRRFIEVFAAAAASRAQKVRAACDDLWKALSEQPLLYVPLAKGGSPREIVAVRTRQHAHSRFALLAAAAGAVGGNVRAAGSRPRRWRRTIRSAPAR